MPGTPIMEPLKLITLKPGDSFSNVSIFADINQEIVQQSNLLKQRLIVYPSLFQIGPRLGVNVIDSDLENQTRSIANKHWFWKSESYSITLSCNVGAVKYEMTKLITLTSDQVNKMKAIVTHYKEGFGLIYYQHLTQIAEAQSFFYIPAK